ncbi:uncharacterized protein BJX67DRAFT_362108 [Aspergillus lucknowensis]|uniref:DUF7730 domain-containing protein n=1 Tax=Aspergillus lucknowensis TaxID=176173 RepID=A0ABR4LHU8_9EURO
MPETSLPSHIASQLNPPSTPVPALPPRKRALTPPLPPQAASSSWLWFRKPKPQETYDQSQSSFLTKLPYEIRQIIYRELLAPPGSRLHISTHYKKRTNYLASVCCYESRNNLLPWNHRCWVRKRDAKGNKKYPDFSPHRKRGRVRVYLSILRCCRTVYAESITLLYTVTTFSVRSDSAICDLARVIRPHRLQMIRSLQFDTCAIVMGIMSHITAYSVLYWQFNAPATWKEAWDVIASMTGLQTLHVSLTAEMAWERGVTIVTIPWIVEPMKGIRFVRDYQVVVYCPEELDEMAELVRGAGEGGRDSELPFVLNIIKKRIRET